MTSLELIGVIASVIAIYEFLYKVVVHLYQKKIFRWHIMSHHGLLNTILKKTFSSLDGRKTALNSGLRQIMTL